MTDLPPDDDLGRMTSRGLERLQAFLTGDGPADGVARLADLWQTDAGPRTFGRFLVRRTLGHGRFGIVFLADDPQIGRAVALKVPQLDVLDAPDRLRWFYRDAEAAGLLDHPNIVPVFDAGQVGPVPYIVSAYVDGPSLQQWLRETAAPVPLLLAGRLFLAAAGAVAHAHDRGVLHCDIKPGNILLAGDGDEVTPRIADFGLARLIRPDAAATRTAAAVGTLAYMAPEQATGRRRDLTARCDVYALGATFYEVLTGRPPFASASDVDTLRQLLQDEPVPPHRRRPDVPRDLSAIVLTCLDKDPARRYPSAADLVADLERWQAGQPTRARPVGVLGRAVRWVRRRPAAAVMVLALFTTLAAVGYAGWQRYTTIREVDEARRLATVQTFYAGLQQVRQRRLEPAPGWTALNRAAVAELATLPPAAEYAEALRTEAAAALTAVDVLPAGLLFEGAYCSHLAFSADGRWAAAGEAFPSEATLRVWLVAWPGREVRAILRYPIDREWEEGREKGRFGDGAHAIAFSPDGQWLVVGSKSGWLMAWQVDRWEKPPVRWRAHNHTPDEECRIRGLGFTADGGLLLSSSADRTRRWDVCAGWRPVGEVVPGRLPENTPVIPDRVRLTAGPKGGTVLNVRTGTAAAADPPADFSPPHALTLDGRLAVVSKQPLPYDVWLVRTEDRERLFPLAAPQRAEWQIDPGALAFAPTGQHLLTPAPDHGDVRLWDSVGGTLLTRMAMSGGTLAAAFTADGRHFAVSHADRVRLFELTCPAVRTVVSLQPTPLRTFDLSADGQTLLTQSTRTFETTAETGVYRRPPGGAFALKESYRRADGSERYAFVAVSPNGGQVVFTTREYPQRLERPDGTHVSGEDLTGLQFGPDGRLWASQSTNDPAVPVLAAWRVPGFDLSCQVRHTRQELRDGLTLSGVAPGRWLVAAGHNHGKVVLYTPDGKHLRTVTPFPEEQVRQLAVSAKDDLVLAATVNGAACVLQADTGQVTVDLPRAHTREVTGVGFGPGGTLVTAARDQTVKLWSSAGEPLLTLRESGPIRRIRLAPDGGELFVLVEGELALRRYDLTRLHAGLLALGLDPGYPAPATAR